ncbi:hypothetical protein ACF0H5_013744 [Mactra antiquata]
MQNPDCSEDFNDDFVLLDVSREDNLDTSVNNVDTSVNNLGTSVNNIDTSVNQSSTNISTNEIAYAYNDNHMTDDIWIKNLHLSQKDKDDVIANKKLSSNHMEAVNILLRKQFGHLVNGLQLPERVPVFDESEHRWRIGNVMSPANHPCCQIHYTHRDHWVVSLSTSDTHINLFDSLGTDRAEEKILSNGLKIQLSLIYGSQYCET